MAHTGREGEREYTCSTGEVAEASFDGGVAVVDGECKDALEHGGRTRRVRRL
jgi:hypothetical protein